MILDAKLDILRNLGVLPESLFEDIVLKINCQQQAADYFREKLSKQLYSRNKLPLSRTSIGNAANICHFDSFLSALAASHQLLNVIIKDV